MTDALEKVLTRHDLERIGIKWNNGVGGRLFPKHNYSVIYRNGSTKYYGIKHETIPTHLLETFCRDHQRGASNQIIGVYIHSIRHSTSKTRPIRHDIRAVMRRQPCVVCGTSTDVLPDHKNDIYNDPRVLSLATQTIDDFQTLCRHCNLRKREIAKKEAAEQKIFSAKNMPQFQHYTFPFPWEACHYDTTDPMCKQGSFWYDPVEFNRKVFIYTLLHPVLSSIRKKNDLCLLFF